MEKRYQPTEAERKQLAEWIESRPPAVKEVAKKLNPFTCYRLKDNPGHYSLYSILEPKGTGPCTVTIIHGHDSYLAGIRVFDINPDDLASCNCGQWESPTDQDILDRELELPAMRDAIRALKGH